jgi:hypothetical protein
MPHPTILVHLVQVFFEYFSRNFPFLQFDDVSRRMFNGTLSPLLANSIASLAARYSQSPDVVARGTSAVSNAYTDVAKVCVVSVLSQPSFRLTGGHLHTQRLLHDSSHSSHVPYIEILHAVIVLAWSEYKAGRMSGPTEYSQVSLQLIVATSGPSFLTMMHVQMATKLAMSLGLGNDVVTQASSERERTVLRSTWSSVVQLQQIAASRA